MAKQMQPRALLKIQGSAVLSGHLLGRRTCSNFLLNKILFSFNNNQAHIKNRVQENFQNALVKKMKEHFMNYILHGTIMNN